MKRLTKKDRYGHFYTNKANCRNIYSSDGERLEGVFFENQVLAIDGEAIDKLGQLEDIEEEFGIDLITLFKAVMNGFWYKNKYGYHQADDYEYVIDLESNRLVKLYEEDGRIFCFEDYGKDWALTKKELEE